MEHLHQHGLIPNKTYQVYVKVFDNAGLSNTSASIPAITKGELLKPSITPSTLNAYYTGNITINIQDTAEASKTRATKLKYKRNSSRNRRNNK
jgi:hypothetical protein